MTTRFLGFGWEKPTQMTWLALRPPVQMYEYAEKEPDGIQCYMKKENAGEEGAWKIHICCVYDLILRHLFHCCVIFFLFLLFALGLEAQKFFDLCFC